MSSRPRGLRLNVVAGTALVFAGSALRLVPSLLAPAARRAAPSAGWLHAAQILNAVAGPFCMGPVSRLSCVWFPEASYITSHYITLHHITLHYIALYYITLHYA